MTESQVKLSIEKSKLTLSTGSSIPVDLDNDGTDDIKITLESISEGKADVSALHEAPKQNTESKVIEQKEAPIKEETKTEAGVNLYSPKISIINCFGLLYTFPKNP